MLKQKTEYSRYYGDFRGVDFSSDHTLVSERRFPYLVNMYKDYAAGAGQGIETIPGFRRRFVAPNGKKVYGIHSFKDKGGKRHVYVHAGNTLYDWKNYPSKAGFMEEVRAVVREYDEYSESADESVRIDTDYIKVEVSSAADKFIDVRAIRKVGAQRWISIYTEPVYYGETTDALRIPGAYTFAQRTGDDGKVTGAVLKIAKVIRDGSGTVVASFAAGDSIEVQAAPINQYPNGYYSRPLKHWVMDTGKVTADGSPILYDEYDANEIIYAETLARYTFNGQDYCTFITPSAMPSTVYDGCDISEATLIDYIVASDGSRFAPVEPTRVVGADLRVYFIYDAAQGYYYQPAANGTRVIRPNSNEYLRTFSILHGRVEEVAYTALEYDEYAEDGAGDYLEIKGVDPSYRITSIRRASNGEPLVEGDGAGQYKRVGNTILVKKGGAFVGESVLIDVETNLPVELYSSMNDRESQSFVFNNRLYILDGKNYLYIDVTPEEKIEVETEEGTEIKVNPEKTVVKRVADEAYIPTTYINIVVGGENADAGTEYETRNMLSPYFKHTFVPVDSVTEYCMNERDLDGIKEVKVYGKVMKEGEDADYTVDLTDGKVIFNTPPALIKAGFEAVPGTPGLEYTLTDAGTYICSGRGSAVDTEIEIGNYYNGARVTGVDADAFGYTGYPAITKVTISEGITEIDKRAFDNGSITEVTLPESLRHIRDYAFVQGGISSITIPKNVETVGSRAFRNADRLTTVVFKGKPQSIANDAFEECSAITSVTVAWSEGAFPNMENNLISLGATITYKGESADEEEDELYYPELYAGVEITAIKAPGKAKDVVVKNNDGTTTTMKKCPYMYDNAIQMIESATLCTVFDDRVFFSGIPRCPRLILWCGRNLTGYVDPSYIGILNYVEDGVGNSPVRAMLPLANTLLVLKGDTELDGAVYYHTPRETGIDVMPKTYPSEHGLSGIGCLGAACNFLDDPVFISRLGLEAIGQLSVRYERAREHRSSLIDAKLVNLEGLRDAKTCEWNGYLVLLVDGKIFLADSRQVYQNDRGEVEYEWYYLEDIGVFEGQYPRERYIEEWPSFFCDENGEKLRLTVMHDGIEYTVKLASDEFGDNVLTEVSGERDALGNRIIPVEVGYIEINGNTYIFDAAIYDRDKRIAFLCDGDGEMIGGEFSPAITVKSIEEGCKSDSAKGRVVENLFFGTENGVVCSFNFDMREADGTIPAEYYTFDERAIYSGCALKMDNCGIPHMTKTTVKKSTVIKVKSFQSTAAKVRVRTNVNPYNEIARINATRFSFDNLDFSDFSFVVGEDSLFAVQEKEKKWVEKQYYIYSDEYKKPFALFYAAFKYFVAGKFKK